MIALRCCTSTHLPAANRKKAINTLIRTCNAPRLNMASKSSSSPVKFITFASGAEGPISGSDVPFDMSASGKASSNEGQMEAKEQMQQDQGAMHGSPNPDAASMADSNVVNEPDGLAEQTNMSVQDRAPATDLDAMGMKPSQTMADKMGEALKEVQEGTAAGQHHDDSTGTDSASEMHRGRM